MPEEEKPKCDIDDILCQFQVLGHLGGMKRLIGTEKFKEQYPDFKDLDEVVREKIKEHRFITKELMEKCGMPTEEFEEEMDLEEEV